MSDIVEELRSVQRDEQAYAQLALRAAKRIEADAAEINSLRERVEELEGKREVDARKEKMMNEAQIKYMAGRFLAWNLPADFFPDGGVSFVKNYNNGTPNGGEHKPVGTNLLNADQAEAMVRHMLDGLPSS